MITILSPSFSGNAPIQTLGSTFLERFKKRVEIGLLTGHPHWRSRYRVTEFTGSDLAFRAASFMTAIAIGLNNVRLRLSPDGGIEYSVTYRLWAAYCVALSAVLGVMIVLTVTFFGTQEVMDAQRLVPDPVLNRQLASTVFWGMVGFWGIIWPWILIVMHKQWARRTLDQIIAQVDAQAE